MNSIRIRAHAKVNLGLAVLGVREDGYHEIDTVFQTISIADTLVISRRERGVSLVASGIAVPGGTENLAWRAADAFRERVLDCGVAIDLTKRIPVAAGLGGGSADAAAVLVGLDALHGTGLSAEVLESLGLSIGSDVPFLLRGGTARAGGRGERLERLRPLAGAWFVLATPGFGVTAAEVYRRARIRLTPEREFIRLICSGIQEGDAAAVAAAMRNDLETGVTTIYPEIRRIKQALSEAGCAGVVMSGSGSTVVGLVRTREEADSVRSRLAGRGWSLLTAAATDAGCEEVGSTDVGGGAVS